VHVTAFHLVDYCVPGCDVGHSLLSCFPNIRTLLLKVFLQFNQLLIAMNLAYLVLYVMFCDILKQNVFFLFFQL